MSRTLLAAAVVALGALGCAAERPAPASPQVAIVRPAPEPAPAQRAPEDEIQLQGELGTLDPAQIEAPFRRAAAEVDGCYRRGLAKVWYLGGEIELKLRVARDGAVTSAQVARPLGNLEVERCLTQLARTLRFSAPHGNAEAEFSYSLRFRGKAQLRDWGPAEVGEVFAAHRSALDACARKAPVPGEVRVTLFVPPGGLPSSVGVGGDGPLDERYTDCVVRAVSRWRFPDPRGRVARATWSTAPSGSPGS